MSEVVTGMQVDDAEQQKPKRVGRPQGSSREQTVAKILKSALKCFTQKGFANTTFKNVASGAGITSPAIYQYFNSKADLYGATLEGIYTQLLPKIETSMAEHSGLRRQLRGLLMAAVELHESNPDVTAFLSSVPVESSRHSELKSYFSARNSALLSVVRDMFDNAKACGEIHAARSTESLTMVFISSAMGMALYHHGSQSISMREAAETYIDLLENQLFVE